MANQLVLSCWPGLEAALLAVLEDEKGGSTGRGDADGKACRNCGRTAPEYVSWAKQRHGQHSLERYGAGVSQGEARWPSEKGSREKTA